MQVGFETFYKSLLVTYRTFCKIPRESHTLACLAWDQHRLASVLEYQAAVQMNQYNLDTRRLSEYK